MDDLLREFLTETNESLAVLDLELVKLEQNPEDPKLLGSIFRIVHTIKGTCGFLGLPRLERVAGGDREGDRHRAAHHARLAATDDGRRRAEHDRCHADGHRIIAGARGKPRGAFSHGFSEAAG